MNLSLIWELARANLKSRYRDTWAGFLWVILNPIIMFGVQSFVFKKILRLDVQNYYLFLMSGLLPWIFLVQSAEMSTSIFVVNGTLLKSFKMDPRILILAQLVDNFVNFLSVFVILFIVSLFLNNFSHPEALVWLPLAFFILILAGVGLGLFFATLQVFFRDTRFIVQFLFQILFFLTPIFYPLEFVPDNYRFLVSYNPFYAIVSLFRNIFIDYQVNLYLIILLRGLGWLVLIWIISLLLWNKKKNELLLRI